MVEFKSELRQRAVRDGLTRVIGICHFVTGVLVPELAVMLIKDDMKLCDESARQILGRLKTVKPVFGTPGKLTR